MVVVVFVFVFVVVVRQHFQLALTLNCKTAKCPRKLRRDIYVIKRFRKKPRDSVTEHVSNYLTPSIKHTLQSTWKFTPDDDNDNNKNNNPLCSRHTAINPLARV